MKPNLIILLTTCLLVSFFSFAQVQKPAIGDDSRYRLQLQNGSFIPQKNITTDQVVKLNRKAIRVNRKSFVIIQFETNPTSEQRRELQQAGIELLEYIPHNAYTATIKDSLSSVLLNKMKARAVFEPSPEQKMQAGLDKGMFPAYAVKTPGTVDLLISFPRSFSYEAVSTELKKRNIDIVLTDWQIYGIIGVRIADNRLKELAALPCIEYIEAVQKEDEPLNNKSTANARANILHSSLPGGRNLHGEGVVIGVGDDSNPLNHIDLSGRLINRAAIPGGSHGVHVQGIAVGGGIVDEKFTGFAPKATIISQNFSNILAYAPAYVQDYGMVITNNSYGNVASCASFGVYDLYSRVMDQQAFRLPNLQHVFAAGNSGGVSCVPYAAGFGNVLGAYQSAKNVISVGNTTELGLIALNSSKGPVRDGRIKPEIVAQGTRVRSTIPVNSYGSNNGTSMSSPAVAGGLALLYQRYRQLHTGLNPKNGLMKALLCNGATDLGNPGPDYSYGFGWMNLLRSVTMLENNGYFHDSVNVSATKTHTITIPPGSPIARLKVMLYWNDSAAAVLTSQTLVNDLDLEVTDPSLTIHYPQKLDTVPSQVNNPVTTGVDHINNIEQVVIDNPVAGTYTFSVKGTTIPFAPRYEYFLVYDTVPVSAKLTFPIGNERLQQGDSIYISWDADGNPANDFTLQYSTNNGGSWTTILPATIAANLRQLKWFIPTLIADPSIVTDQARIKLIHNGTGIESISEPFTIIGVPVLMPTQCEGYATLSWAAITNATDYEVMMLKGDEMVPIGTIASLTYTISGLSPDSVYWFSVRARINGSPGRRAFAVSIQPNGATCGGTISDNDLRMVAIISPVSSGRKLTSTELSNNDSITIHIRNLDNAATVGNIPVAYKIGSNPQVNETIIAPNIAAGTTYSYTFATHVDLSAVGVYPIKVWVSYPGDVVTANDTLVKTFKQLDNPFVDLNTADFLDDIESAAVQSHTTPQIGLEGRDRYDFVTTTVFGRIRSFLNSGMAHSGNKALILDADRYNPAGTADSLKATFNLTGFNVITDDIRLDFQYKQHGQVPDAANKVWIRGDDQKPWIEVYDLDDNQEELGVFKKSPSIELSDILAANAQTFSSSFQVRWGQWGQILAADDLGGAGYSFDDIHLYHVTDDIHMVSIDTPVVSSCALTATTPVRVSVRNNTNSAIINIPVRFQADGGTIVNETIPSIAANTTISYSFTATADFSAAGIHTLTTWVRLATDTYRANDTVNLVLNNSPVITVFPYLQNFESDNGSWYSDGLNNSWEYGTPSSIKINRAASGSKAWKTSLTGNYNDRQLSYLYSPCFDITGMTSPTLSLSLALDLEDCGGVLCDAAYVEYSADGQAWSRLGTTGAGTNWYNKNYGGNHVWSVQDYTRWHVATIPLPSGLSRLRLRVVVESDPYVSLEGVAIDDIHIYDNVYGIYTGPPTTSPVINVTPVNGTGWIDFTDGGKLVASINPNGQNMGSTDVQGYIHTGSVRINSGTGQYYHNRNITIKPASVNLADSATVRFYFLDSETEALINATGCGLCSKPTTAYQLGISKYSHTNDALENGSLSDNSGGNLLFIIPSNVVKVPFDRGYYAEFKVKDFSEFWLNSGGPNSNQTLPVELISFKATRQPDNDVLVEWMTASEINTSKYEVELAKGNDEFRQNHFVKIGDINSNGNSSTQQYYQFRDTEKNKFGIRYYRLKIIDRDGRFSYSQIRPVVFNEEIQWQVYPNPSAGAFNLIYQVNAGEWVNIKIYDINGKEVKQARLAANGFIQKTEIDLAGKRFVPGMYLLEVMTEAKNGFSGW